MLKLILAALLIDMSSCVLNPVLIKDFFEAKHTARTTIFGCSKKKEYVDIFRYLSKFQLNIFNIFNEDLQLKSILYRDYFHLSIVLDGDCPDFNLFLEECGELNLFTETRHWLIISNKNDSIFEDLQNVNLNINADVNVALPHYNEEGNYENWTVFDYYNTAYLHKGEFRHEIIGYYTEEMGYPSPPAKNKYWRRKNMTGTYFTTAIVIPHPISISLDEYLRNHEQREKNSQNRFQAITVSNCRDFYNFTMKVRRIDSWGYIQKDTGKFNGLVGLLEKKAVDFGCTPLLYKLDRMPAVGYSFGNWILKSTFIYRPPKSQLSSLDIFLRPLSGSVWICTLFLSIFVLIILKIILRTEGSYMSFVMESFESTWTALCLFIISTYCQQGAPTTPVLTSGRIIAMTLFLFAFMIYQFYAGYIVSYLLMDPPRTINNLEDLLHSTLQAGIEDILIDRDYFVQTTDPFAIKLYEEKIHSKEHDGFYTPKIGLKQVKEGGFAFHVEVSTAYPIIRKTFSSKIICELEEVQMYRTQPMHMSLQKHSPFLEAFNYCMLRQVEHGIMNRLRSYWSAVKPECIESEKSKEITVGLEELMCAIIILSIGVVLSLTILIFEIVHKKYQNEILISKMLVRRKLLVKKTNIPYTN